MMVKLGKALKDRRGMSVPLAAAIVIVLIMLTAAISEYIRLNIIAQGIRDALESAVIATVNDNYDDVYHGLREGYAAGYQPFGAGFEESVNYGEIYKRLDEQLGLRRIDGYHTKSTADGHHEFKLWELNVTVNNAPIAPSDPENTERFTVDADIKAEIPVRFAGKILPPLTLTLKVQAGWTKRF